MVHSQSHQHARLAEASHENREREKGSTSLTPLCSSERRKILVTESFRESRNRETALFAVFVQHPNQNCEVWESRSFVVEYLIGYPR